ncbi:hypothetical protein BO86DRAFT_452825 [Aspergillus japonicus CBS 114.51]|uniref:Uncharacterized protein n=1 Tax=Aspergillus japonicus CBS 114.51 TaxID=1448312 RepID=A0A8T8XG73_ASPJA|nr:hypothetical protein BO86DRAFT_452825 [Aspergillus japonicus CBS 114.51]RAH86369.1 hypothetical protein BO86DRAFT_452825 [Aspergillus japonicus CBS 114.51]
MSAKGEDPIEKDSVVFRHYSGQLRKNHPGQGKSAEGSSRSIPPGGPDSQHFLVYDLADHPRLGRMRETGEKSAKRTICKRYGTVVLMVAGAASRASPGLWHSVPRCTSIAATTSTIRLTGETETDRYHHSAASQAKAKLCDDDGKSKKQTTIPSDNFFTNH